MVYLGFVRGHLKKKLRLAAVMSTGAMVMRQRSGVCPPPLPAFAISHAMAEFMSTSMVAD